MTGRGYWRCGAVAAILGGIVLLVATSLHPLDADPGDPVAAFTEYAADDRWVTTHLGQFFGVFLMAGGLIALYDTLAKERAGWIARFGLFAAVASVAITAMLQAIDGVALKVMVDAWLAAPAEDKHASFLAAHAIRQVEVGLASLVSVLFGTTIGLYGIAVAVTRVYPQWLGWVGAIAGAGTLAGGLVTAHDGFSAFAMSFNMPFNLTIVFWMIAMGALMWRQGGSEE